MDNKEKEKRQLKRKLDSRKKGDHSHESIRKIRRENLPSEGDYEGDDFLDRFFLHARNDDQFYSRSGLADDALHNIFG